VKRERKTRLSQSDLRAARSAGMSPNPTRKERRASGKRRLKREAHRDVVRVLELHEKGFKAETIAATVSVTVEFVELVLRHADEVREGEGA
jgi:hypothetical protein